MSPTLDTDKILHLDPAVVLADPDHNIRHEILPMAVDKLAESIVAEGQVNVPVIVEPMEKDKAGHTYRLIVGFIRHAAVTKLNAENAGLTLPAIVRDHNEDASAVLLTQVRENVDRQDMTPMDKARSIKQLLDAGVERIAIRTLFSEPGGRKSQAMIPASNAKINMLVSFLDLPKTMQQKIHDGRIGVAAAYELTRVSPDKRQAVLDSAEADRQKQIDKEERDEEKFLNAEKKVEEAEAKAREATTELEAATKEAQEAEALMSQKAALLGDAYLEVVKPNLDEKALKEAKEHHRAVEADNKAAQKLAFDAKKKLGRLQNKAKSAADVAAQKKKALETARKAKAKPSKAKATSAADVKKAAAAEGEGSGYVALTASQIKDSIKEVIKTTASERVARVMNAVMDCFVGKTTPKLLNEELMEILGAGAKVAGKKKATEPAKT